MKDFVILGDAGETIVVSRNYLLHVEQEVMDRIRPAKFREIIKVDSSIPDWAEGYSYDKVTEFAQWVPAQEFTEDFATATTKIDTTSGKLFEMVSGYRYGARELIRAQKTGINLDSARANAVMLKGEKVLEHLASDGTIDGTKQLGNLTGLYNTAGTTVLGTTASTAALAGRTTSYEIDFAAVSTNDQYNAACEKFINDMLYIEDTSVRLTKETTPIDTLVLPLSLSTVARKSKLNSGDKTLEAVVLERARFVKRFVYWYKADEKAYGADAAYTRRIVGLASQDTDAARFILPRAPTPGAPFQLMHGAVHVPVGMVVGGFNTKIPGSIIYADIDNAS